MTGLDATDIRMAQVCVNYYISALKHMKRPVPESAHHLLANITALADIGQEPVVVQQELLTTAEVAQRLGCSTRTAQRIANRVGYPLGPILVVPADAIVGDEDD